jgi:cytoskeletal protein RodZ
MTTPENPPPGGDAPGRGLSGVQRAGIVLGGLAVLLIVFVVLQSGGGDKGGSTSSQAAQTTTTQSTTTTQTGSAATTTEDNGGGSATTTTGADDNGGGGTDDTTAETKTVTVVNGQPQGGVQTISFKKGDQVRLKVQSDVADEIHVHGYDLKKDVTKGGSVTFNFKATIEGRFEIELENAGTQIANLEVTPS